MMRHLVRAALLLSLAGCGRGKSASLPDVRLTANDGSVSPTLASCPTPKCFTVVVAPWCGYCRAGTPIMLRLRPWLAQRGVTMRFIVGLDTLENLKANANEFGPDTMIDPQRRLKVSSGVPHFYVTDAAGSIIKEVAGMPMVEDLESFAGYFGLP